MHIDSGLVLLPLKDDFNEPTVDYLDPDVAYFLGLLVAMGQISESNGVRRIVFEFPFRNLKVEGIKLRFTQKNEILIGLRQSIRRIAELTEATPSETDTDTSVVLTIESLKNTMFWRIIRLLTGGKSSYYEFDIPPVIYQAGDTIKKEFLRGYADVAAYARKGNYDIQGKHRVYFDVLNPNWHLPVQLCHLLQDHLKIPVQTIDYGHPNSRDPKLKEYKKGRLEAWAREHQIKVYCDAFQKVGFYMQHKQKILEELAKANIKEFGRSKTFCDPPKTGEPKKVHPGEKSTKLPPELRGVHAESYTQICRYLGCPRQDKCLGVFRPYMGGYPRQSRLRG